MTKADAAMFPWHDPVFAGWSIVGMNHYHVSGERRLFVAMTRENCCIKVEGRDDGRLWNALRAKAAAAAVEIKQSICVQITAEMIASNIPSHLRVAPIVARQSIIDDIYAFSELLRAGS
jgi:hypothetical protein